MLNMIKYKEFNVEYDKLDTVLQSKILKHVQRLEHDKGKYNKIYNMEHGKACTKTFKELLRCNEMTRIQFTDAIQKYYGEKYVVLPETVNKMIDRGSTNCYIFEAVLSVLGVSKEEFTKMVFKNLNCNETIEYCFNALSAHNKAALFELVKDLQKLYDT